MNKEQVLWRITQHLFFFTGIEGNNTASEFQTQAQF